MELIEEEFGDTFDIRKDETLEVIPTGSISLDCSTGIGGIPKARFTEIYGPESSGKTTLCLSISKEALRLGNKVLFIDAENGLDAERAKQLLGDYDEEQFVLKQPEYMEEALKISEIGIRSGEFGLVILDSIGSLAPKKVKEDDLMDDNVALLSRRMTIFVVRNIYNLRNSNVAFIGTNQVRDKIGAYFSTYETPGGHQWKHICSLRVQLSKGTSIEQGGENVGILTKFVVKKNKLAKPLQTEYIPFMFDSGVDSLRNLVDFATMLGIVTKGGPYYKYGETNLGLGINNTLEYLKENPETLDNIRKVCYDNLIKE